MEGKESNTHSKTSLGQGLKEGGKLGAEGKNKSKPRSVRVGGDCGSKGGSGRES